MSFIMNDLFSGKKGELKKNLFVGFLILVVLVFSVVYLNEANAVTQSSTTANVSIATSIGFTFSTNLSNGITFTPNGTGNLFVNTNDNNATSNNDFNWTNNPSCSIKNCTGYWINMDSANNANTDTCIRNNVALTSGSNTIPNTGFTYDANKSANGSNMNSPTGSTAFTTVSTKFGDINLGAGENQTAQFYLDVPNSQASGNYNDTVEVKILQTGGAC